MLIVRKKHNLHKLSADKNLHLITAKLHKTTIIIKYNHLKFTKTLIATFFVLVF